MYSLGCLNVKKQGRALIDMNIRYKQLVIPYLQLNCSPVSPFCALFQLIFVKQAKCVYNFLLTRGASFSPGALAIHFDLFSIDTVCMKTSRPVENESKCVSSACGEKMLEKEHKHRV